MSVDIAIINDGPLITYTTFWGSQCEALGWFYCSVHEGVIRLLIPNSQRKLVVTMQQSPHVILSRGPWKQHSDAMQLTFINSSPLCNLFIPPKCADSLPSEPEAGREWILSAWICLGKAPYKAFQLPCKWRRSEKLPDDSAWRAPRPIQKSPSLVLDESSSPRLKRVMAAIDSSANDREVMSRANIIGLPRILSSNGGERLLKLLALDMRYRQRRFLAHPALQRWAQHRGIDISEFTADIACRFYANKKYRIAMLDTHLAESSKKATRNDIYTPCLEQRILYEYFRNTLLEATNGLSDHNAIRSLKLDDADRRHQAGMLVAQRGWAQVKRLLVAWDKLEAEKREAAILGLFALTTLKGNDLFVRRAIRVVPQLQDEFAGLRVIDKRVRPTRIPTPEHVKHLQRRCKVQIQTVRACAEQLLFERPSAEGMALLERKIGTLVRVVHAQEQLRSALDAVG